MPNWAINDPYEEGEEEEREVLGVPVERRDPYGHWYVKKPKSRLLEGSFTSIRELEKAILLWQTELAGKVKTKKTVNIDVV